VNALLLHEAYPDNTSRAAWETIEALRDWGRTDRIGLGEGAIAAEAMRALAPAGAMVQAAVPPEAYLLGEAPGADRLHSVVKCFNYVIATDAAVADAADAATCAHRGDLGLDGMARVSLAYALLMERWVSCELLFSTTSRSKAQAFISTIAGFTPSKLAAIASTYRSRLAEHTRP
jgi:hypothetical protein